MLTMSRQPTCKAPLLLMDSELMHHDPWCHPTLVLAHAHCNLTLLWPGKDCKDRVRNMARQKVINLEDFPDIPPHRAPAAAAPGVHTWNPLHSTSYTIWRQGLHCLCLMLIRCCALLVSFA